jgi:hypothetical protein
MLAWYIMSPEALAVVVANLFDPNFRVTAVLGVKPDPVITTVVPTWP